MAPKKMTGRLTNQAIEERRAKVLAAYRDGKTTPSAIAEALKLPRKTVENDLSVLRAAGKLAKGERPTEAPKPGRKPKAKREKKAPAPKSAPLFAAPHFPISKEMRAATIAALREELTRLDEDAKAVSAAIRVLQRGES